MKEKQMLLGLEVEFGTELFGKPYIWAHDSQGTVALIGFDENEEPYII